MRMAEGSMDMEENRKTVSKYYLPHQYEKEEQFLVNMAAQGWHLKQVRKGVLAWYDFIEGEKEHFSYQLDYVRKEEDTPDYHQLYSDAGWEEICSYDGIYEGKWYYFRKPCKDEQLEKIFTDTESKYTMFDKLWKQWGLFGILIIYLEFNGLQLIFRELVSAGTKTSPFLFILFVFCALILIIYLYLVIGLYKEKRKWKQKVNGKI